MAQWLRFQHQGTSGLGQLNGDHISVYSGNLFQGPKPTGETLKLADVTIDIPCTPSKMVAMVDNFHALVTKLEHAVPAEPLYFLKGNNSFLAANQIIRTPKSYSGKVVYEGELGIVIGKHCHEADEAQAAQAIFGYTCINDVTAIEILNREPGYAQWTRSKSFNTFGVFGPYITTDIDPSKLTIKTILNEQERQNYPVSDMIFPPAKLVSLISQDVPLEPGDIIACGTSVGVGSMKPGSSVSIIIEGVGRLDNRFE
ncbi:fumarylacetoacetate hydrolase family protein [Polynucleobacter sp. MWH-Creno-3A4]|jgi:2-keto-4-pentenoate hydratase/2-oxohepta-3-ene-1,7-dioic acid hydratase in catechol pathway|uniref:fumarylacetoacetate hydrolase family protein n=1 Tax=Polynucleobacter sp. MWH-Creno-3A4 TaxID=1855886 RepID=UPI001C0AEFFA|nr:fumarylacetoacetate hydrolase family protein [Polynucleobacter sp. MWH-Creno-3A4]MBU3606012.1 fumarylacetoacetate hydrolase family protein [Polynucleobacter sp. MWH-Creno-3A4]